MYRIVPTPAALVPGGRGGGFAAANRKMEQSIVKAEHAAEAPNAGTSGAHGVARGTKINAMSRRPSVFNVAATAFAAQP